jgi:hypothetical protein
MFLLIELLVREVQDCNQLKNGKKFLQPVEVEDDIKLNAVHIHELGKNMIIKVTAKSGE